MRLSPLLPGLLACVAAVALSVGIHALAPSIPVLTSAVVLGILVANVPVTRTAVDTVLKPGLGFAGKRLMRAGIVLLGLKLSVVDILALGWETFAAVIVMMLLAFAGTYALGRLFRLPGDQPVLIASGFAICGASAIGAMSGARGSDERDTVLPIALVTLCGTLAIAVLPTLMVPLGLGPVPFGQWVGASVHDVGQVVATAQTAGTAALAAAVLIKLTRVLMLAPMVTAAALMARRAPSSKPALLDTLPDEPMEAGRPQPVPAAQSAPTAKKKAKLPPLIPLFIIGFVLMVAVRSLSLVGDDFLAAAAVIQDLLLGAALFGLGSGVRIRQLVGQGGRAVIMAMLSWVLIAALGYLLVILIAA